MDRHTACLHQAELCRKEAEKDHHRSAYWHGEADRWERAALLHDKVAVTFYVDAGHLIPKHETSQDATSVTSARPLGSRDGKIP